MPSKPASDPPPPPPPKPSSSTPSTRVLALISALAHSPTYTGFDTSPLHSVKFLSADPSTKTTHWTLTVPPSLCNKSGTLHGGAAATLLDTLTTTAIIAFYDDANSEGGGVSGWDHPGVSRTLSVSYHRPVPMGATVGIECEMVAVGRRLASARGVVRILGKEGENGGEAGKGKVCVTCVHDKVNVLGERL